MRLSENGIASAAGWLFADLTLALAVVLMADGRAPDRADPRAAQSATETTARPSATAARTATATVMAPPPLPGLDPAKIVLRLDLPDDAMLAGDPRALEDAAAQLGHAFSPDVLGDRRVGLVLTFGGAQLSDLSQGVRFAASVNDRLRVLPHFGDAVFETLVYIEPPAQFNTEIWVYLFNDPE